MLSRLRFVPGFTPGTRCSTLAKKWRTSRCPRRRNAKEKPPWTSLETHSGNLRARSCSRWDDCLCCATIGSPLGSSELFTRLSAHAGTRLQVRSYKCAPSRFFCAPHVCLWSYQQSCAGVWRGCGVGARASGTRVIFGQLGSVAGKYS